MPFEKSNDIKELLVTERYPVKVFNTFEHVSIVQKERLKVVFIVERKIKVPLKTDWQVDFGYFIVDSINWRAMVNRVVNDNTLIVLS